MPGERASAGQEKASRAQARADRTGAGKQKAGRMQSEADRAAYPKHGL